MFDSEEIFDRFRSGETSIICNVATRDTGIDLDVRCIIDARPTKSRIRFVQTIGRGLRPAEGKDHLIVLDHAGNHQRLGLVTNIHFGELDDGLSNRNLDKGKADPEPIIKLCPDCRCVLAPRARECPACGAKIYAATEIRERDGELVELGSATARLPVGERHKQAWAGKDLWHGALVKIALQKGYPKARPTLNFPPEREPTVEILTWVKSKQIAYAKARQASG